MAKFYGSVKGNRGEATRCGTPRSGLVAYANGWNQGGLIRCGMDGEDEVTHIFATGGSQGNGHRQVAWIREGKLYVRDRHGKDGFIHLPW